MMGRFMTVMCTYFIYEVCINGLYSVFRSLMIEGEPIIDPYATVNQQFFDILIIVSLLIVVRPKVWPRFFHVAFLEDYEVLLENESMLPIVREYVMQQH